MKQLILVLVLCLFSTLTNAKEFILIKEGEKVNVYEYGTRSNDYTYVYRYNFVNPTIENLNGIDFPKEYWYMLKSNTIVFSSETNSLVNRNRNLSQEVNMLEDQVRDYERGIEGRNLSIIFLCFSTLLFLGISVYESINK